MRTPLRRPPSEQHHRVEALAAEESAVERHVAGGAQSSAGAIFGNPISRCPRSVPGPRSLERKLQEQMIDEPLALARQRVMQHFIIGERGQKFIEGTEQIVSNAGIADGHGQPSKQPLCQRCAIGFPVAVCAHEGDSRAAFVRATGQPRPGFRTADFTQVREKSMAGSTGGVSSLC